MRSGLRAASSLPAIACGLCLSCWLLACEQASDVVLRVEALPLDGGDNPDDASTPPDNTPNETVDAGIVCDPAIPSVYAAFSRVALDGCAFPVNDLALIGLLFEHIFSQPPPRESVEGRPFSACDTGVFGRGFSFPELDGTRLVLCPGYCSILNTWLVDHEAQSRACLPGSGN